MQKSREYFVKKFNKFNTLIFNDKLPLPVIILSDAATFLGKCSYRTHRLSDGRIAKSEFRLRFSIRHSMSEDMWEDVVIHEMIHYYIAYCGITDSSSHGPVFRNIMNDINLRFNRNISISHRNVLSREINSGDGDIAGSNNPDIKPESAAVITESRRRIIVVARLEFHNGDTALKVLPKVGTTIHKYCRTWIRQKDVSNIKLYVSDNIFFNRYPSSGALKAYPCNKEILDKALADAVAFDDKTAEKFFK